MNLALNLPYWYLTSPNETAASIVADSAGTNIVLHHKGIVIMVASTKFRHTLFDTEPRCLNLVTATSTITTS